MPEVHNKYIISKDFCELFLAVNSGGSQPLNKNSAFSARHCEYSENSVNSQESAHATNRTITKHPLAAIYLQSVGCSEKSHDLRFYFAPTPQSPKNGKLPWDLMCVAHFVLSAHCLLTVCGCVMSRLDLFAGCGISNLLHR